MKILFWSFFFWPDVGGVEIQNLEFIKGMQAKGHEYHVITHGAEEGREVHQNILIQRFPFCEIMGKKQLHKITAIKNYLEELKKSFIPDIIHVVYGPPEFFFIFFLLRQVFSCRAILTVHTYSNKEIYCIPRVDRTVLPTFDLVCCVSDWVVKLMQEQGSVPQEKLRLIYNGLPPKRCDPLPLSFSPATLLIYGRHTKEKGFETAIYAFSLLKQRGSSARLIIGGDGILRASLEAVVDTFNLRSSVQFTGMLSQVQVLEYLNQATLVIVPSLQESFGLVALEAMQMKRPVIASRVEGLQEVVLDNETGLFVHPEDPEALCLAIEQLLNDPETARRMGEAGRERALSFSLENNLNQYEQMYQSV